MFSVGGADCLNCTEVGCSDCTATECKACFAGFTFDSSTKKCTADATYNCTVG